MTRASAEKIARSRADYEANRSNPALSVKAKHALEVAYNMIELLEDLDDVEYMEYVVRFASVGLECSLIYLMEKGSLSNPTKVST